MSADIEARLQAIAEEAKRGDDRDRALAGCLYALLGAYAAGEEWMFRMLHAISGEANSFLESVGVGKPVN